MFKLLLLVAAVALAQGENREIGFGSFTKFHPKLGQKIVGGENAEAGEFPYQCSLQQVSPLLGSSHYCGGEMISKSTLMTAGHCVTEVNIGPLAHVEVVCGIISLANRGANAQSSKVQKTIVNPDFAGGVAPNDVALHILATPLTLNEYVNIISLPLPDSEPTGVVTLTGWGSTSHSQLPSMPDRLQKIELPVLTAADCEASVEGLGTPLDTTSMVCTGPLTGGYGACSGDSGGPLVSGTGANKTVVGIVSWGFIPCAQAGSPSVFTKVAKFVDFIKANTV